MDLYLGGLTIETIFAPEIKGAYFQEGLFLIFFFFFFGEGGGGEGGLLSEFYGISFNVFNSVYVICY